MIRCALGCGTWRTSARFSNYLLFSNSSTPSALSLSGETQDKIVEESVTENLMTRSRRTEELELTDKKEKLAGEPRRGNNMVAAAFASLKANQNVSRMEKRLENANSIEEVLSFSQHPKFSRQNALQIVSILADWAAKKKVQLSDFESDPRFVHICNILSERARNTSDTSGLGDLATVLGVTGDDEAAKLVSTVSFSQKIRVLTALARKRRRSTVLLRALSFNIGNSEESLDVKQAADLLYAMATLNFPDDVLLKKASVDLCSHLPSNEKPAVVGSVLTSIGLLRYKSDALLDALADWMKNHYSTCRAQDLVAFFLTMASVNYHPQNAHDLYKVILPLMSRKDITRPTVWLDVVWALVVLNLANPEQIQFVLSSDFMHELSESNDKGFVPITSQLKLLNINAAAQLLTEGYNGPFLSEGAIKCSLPRSQEKRQLVESVLNSLSNLLPSATYLRCNVDTGHGFFIDGECAVDNKCTPLPVEETTPKPGLKRIRVAVLVCDYHDMCCGRIAVAGHVSLHERILKKLGYAVMIVPYTEFNPREKLVTRVKYLEQQLRNLSRTAS